MIKDQITENKLFATNVQQYHAELNDLEDCTEWLVGNMPSNPDDIREIHERLAKAREPVKKLAAQVDLRQNQLETAALQSQQFADYFDDFNLKLAGIEDELAGLLPVSAVYLTCTSQLEDVECLEKNVNLQEEMVEKVLLAGQKMMDSLSEGDEKRELEENLSGLGKRWNDLNEKVHERKFVICKVLPLAKDFDKDSSNMLEWLIKTESRVEDFTFESLDCKNVELGLKAFAIIINELRSKITEITKLEEECKNLSDVCETDEDVIESTTVLQRKRYDALIMEARKKNDTLNKTKKLVLEFNDCFEDIDGILSKAESMVKNETCVGIDRHEALLFLEQVENLMDKFVDSEEKLETITSTSLTIINCVDRTSSAARLMDKQVNEMVDRFYIDKDNLSEYFLSRESDTMIIVKFSMIYETVEEGLPLLLESVEALSPVGTKASVLTIQIQETESLLEGAQRFNEKLQAVEEFAEDVQNINKNDPEVIKVVQNMIADLQIPLNEASLQLDDRLHKLQTALLKCNDYEDLTKQHEEKISALDVEVSTMQPVSAVYEQTKKQSEEAERVLGSLKLQEPVYETILEIGRNIQEETDDKDLKEELEDLTAKWQDVLGKSTSRVQTLNVVLPLAKEYSTTKSDFLNWLSEMERRMVNIEEIPLNFENIEKVEKSRNDLEENVEDHKSVYEECISNAVKVIDASEDIVIVDTEMNDIKRRWNDLKKTIHAKKPAVENIKKVLKKHQKALAEIRNINEKIGDIVKSDDSYEVDADKLKRTLEKAKVRQYCI